MDSVRMAEYFKADAPDKAGEAARVLTALHRAGVNLLAFSGFPRGRKSQLDFVPEDPVLFRQVAKQAKLKVKAPKTCFVVTGDDRPGAVAEVLSRIAEAGINITAIDAVVGGQGRYGAIFWVKPKDVKKAGRALGLA